MTGRELSFRMCVSECVCASVCVQVYFRSSGSLRVCVCVSAGDTQRAAVAIFVLPPEIIIYTHRDDTAFVWTVSGATDINFIILNLSHNESNTAETEKQANPK